MKKKILAFLCVAALLVPLAGLISCNKAESDDSAKALLLLNQGQSSFFPVIPKGVAE